MTIKMVFLCIRARVVGYILLKPTMVIENVFYLKPCK